MYAWTVGHKLTSNLNLQLARLRSRHEKEVGELNADLEDAYNSTNSSANARKINELRGEVSGKNLCKDLCCLNLEKNQLVKS